MLLLTNMVYAFALPIIELFIGAYIIRKSNDVSLVMVYQLAQGTGIPVTFIVNGYLLRRFPISRLYALGMIISGIDRAVMMLLPDLNIILAARYISENAALRYALLAVAVVQFLSIFVGRSILNDGEWCEVTKQQPLAPNTLKEPAEL